MLRSDQYYCVGCGRMEKLEEAQVLFRTGFFRIVHPLGCCVSCGEQDQSAPDLSHPLMNNDPMQEDEDKRPIAYPYKERKELAYAF